ncbi:hypothetical protein DEJ13_08735 [Curtobacterium sp. MCLR17_007]|uniref:hypothetical protein n=1 Tax=Curtobacterium sp. MCLR17_007 TaxID=2175648 RepID=UPI000DAA6A8C|nr:hypothetical protein [Curtobacterium sp. MCLR17_007]WIB61901.1 hypothetical protein DEJ13_08735 [Curtobacterium sp. MCLR17_007]
MPPTRLQRSAATLDDLRVAVRTEFGPGARIVSAERVTSGGIGGLFRKAHVEATVEVPAASDPPVARIAIADGPVQRIGIAALLADAEAAEARIAGADGTSTARADAFASVLDGFVADGIAPTPTPALVALEALDGPDAPDAGAPVGAAPGLPSGTAGLPGGSSTLADVVALVPRPAPAAVRAPVPAVLSSDGDLVLLVGRMRDVDAAAGAFAARHGLHGTDAQDRRAGILARAEGVRQGHALLGFAGWDDRAALAGLVPDQVWVVVDAGRKHEDSVAMVSSVTSAVAVAGVVAIGTSETATPDTVHTLGLPVHVL